MQQLTSGTLLRGGTYKIELVLGQGSFGITYLAEHVHLGKKVAIKEFFMKEVNSRGEDGSITGMTDGSLSYNYCRKFQKEAINLSRLEHPNIVRVTDSFSENGTFYYVMDYIEGQNLNDYVKTHQVSAAEALSIIKSVAYALIYMHEEKHMLHLDLKPGNIMRRASDGHIFLIDFGLSKHYDANGQPETSTNIGLGTAGYAPIEQGNQAKSGEFRPTIDVYALGATLYKLLTGETPPPASELVSDDELVEDNLRAKQVSEGLIKVVADAMRPSVKKRTQTVREFEKAFDSLSVSASSTNTSVTEKDNPSKDDATIVSQSDSNNSSSTSDPRTLLAQKYSEAFHVSMKDAQTFVLTYGMAETQNAIDRLHAANDSNSSTSESKKHGKEVKDNTVEDWKVRNSFRPFSFKGRIGRLQLILSYVVGFAAWFASFVLLENNYGVQNAMIAFITLTAVFFWFIYAQSAKRCHDLGKSGAWMFVPFWSILLFFGEGEKQNNEYGQGTAVASDNKGNNIMWILFGIVVVLGVAVISGNVGDIGMDTNTEDEAIAQSTVDWYVDSNSPANVYYTYEGKKYARGRWSLPDGQRTIHYPEDDPRGRESFSGVINGTECTGLLKYRNGDYFNGTISSDQISNGHGKITYDYGSYEGDFQNGLFNGQGSWINSDGTWVYKGSYSNGFKNGSGTEYWPKQKRKNWSIQLDCNYKNDKRNGVGTWYFNNHTYQKCKFKNDKQGAIIEEGTWR